MSAPRRIIVDETHCGRHVTGLERITLELFSADALAPLNVVPVRAGDRKTMMLRQTFGLPWMAMREPRSIVLCPGFPPSPLLTLVGGSRVVPYVHDLFLLTRPQDLNRRAKLYMVAPFRMMIRRSRLFLVNSGTTADELRRFCRPDAEILLYRPRVRNIFGLAAEARRARPAREGALRLIALGTVEPRKNLPAAAAILTALRGTTHPAATLDVVGRPGWGVDTEALARVPGVTLHGYQPTDSVRGLLEAADALISTSHDEGLGLPLLEAQYGGLPVIAPDQPVFREVLGGSGILVSPAQPAEAAVRIGTALSPAGWRRTHANAALANLDRWNGGADRDKLAMIGRLETL